MIRPIAIGLAPNLEKEDALKAVKLLLHSTHPPKSNAVIELETWFEKHFLRFSATTFSSGRGALYAILHCLDIQKDDEVIIPAFTCAAVVYAIRATGATPIYVDITRDFLYDVSDVKKKITKRTKAVILQHTFGLPCLQKEIIELAKKKKICLIEDSAHCITIPSKDNKIGTVGIATLFSFGRDKAFSSVSGGMVITKDKNLQKKLKTFQAGCKLPPSFWVIQQLFHSVSFYFFILPFYNVLGLGKLLLVLFQKLHLLSLPVNKNEEHTFVDTIYKMPAALASMALLQLRRMEAFNTKRREATDFYIKKVNSLHIPSSISTSLPLLRFPILVDNPLAFRSYFRQKGTIYIGTWYSNIIDPRSTNVAQLGYSKGSCPNAEYIASHIVNLPTYPTLVKTDLEKIAMILTFYATSKNHPK